LAHSPTCHLDCLTFGGRYYGTVSHSTPPGLALRARLYFPVGGVAGSERGKTVWWLKPTFCFLCQNAGRVYEIAAIT